MTVALTRSFHDTVAARARGDAGFRRALRDEAEQARADGDEAAARRLLDHIGAADEPAGMSDDDKPAAQARE